MSHEGDGMKLRDLASGSNNPTSFVPALHIFRSRFRDRGISGGRSRKSYEFVLRSFRSAPPNIKCCSERPWSLFLVFFVILAVLAPSLPFILGRIVEIRVFVRVRTTNLASKFNTLIP